MSLVRVDRFVLRQFQCDNRPHNSQPPASSPLQINPLPPIVYIYYTFYIALLYHYLISHFLFAGNLILYTKMAVEILGGWQDSCAHHGLRHRHLFRSREKTKKEITFRLFVGKFKVSIYDISLKLLLY